MKVTISAGIAFLGPLLSADEAVLSIVSTLHKALLPYVLLDAEKRNL